MINFIQLFYYCHSILIIPTTTKNNGAHNGLLLSNIWFAYDKTSPTKMKFLKTKNQNCLLKKFNLILIKIKIIEKKIK